VEKSILRLTQPSYTGAGAELGNKEKDKDEDEDKDKDNLKTWLSRDYVQGEEGLEEMF
jgi:hypothetical protein